MGGVHMLFAGGFEKKVRWKKNETRECRFVFIGRNLDKEALKAGVMECVVKPLRFKVDDLIEANIGDGWVKGKIIKQWDQGHPYRIALEDGSDGQCWGPVDDDR